MSKTTKPAGFPRGVPAPKPLTAEEKKIKVMQFLQQKRENFSISILCALCRANADSKNEELLDRAVSLADGLLEKLYPIPEVKDLSNE